MSANASQAAASNDPALDPATFAIPQQTYTSAPALEVRELGRGESVTQKQALAELAELGAGWRLETPHELFALRSPLTHKNANGAHSYDESIKPSWYWTNEETPWFEGGRVVVGFVSGDVNLYSDGYRAIARAVRVSGQ